MCKMVSVKDLQVAVRCFKALQKMKKEDDFTILIP